MPDSPFQSLILAEELKNEGKYVKALQIIKDFEEKGSLTPLAQNLMSN